MSEGMKRRNWLLVVGLGFAGLILCNCSGGGKKEDGGKKVVVTTFTILADMAREVAGEAAVVECIVKPGAEVHGYEPTPKDIVKVQKADLVLRNGMNLEAWFEKFFQSVEGVKSVVVSEGVKPISIGEGSYEGKANPHAWMAPANAVIYVENIRKALVEMDPENEETYNRNAAAYVEKIKALDEPVRAKLGEIDEGRRWLVTSEGAFSYLCESYGMKELYLWPINADAQGTPQQMRKVIDEVKARGIPVVFSESTVSSKPAEQVAKEAGVRYGGVLYVDSLTLEDGKVPTYLKLLEVNAETILSGFQEAGDE